MPSEKTRKTLAPPTLGPYVTPKAKQARTLVRLTVAYSWSNEEEWKHLRSMLNSAIKDARSRWPRKRGRRVLFDDENESAKTNPARQAAEQAPRCEVRRLRAGAGRFAWEDITRRIKESHLLIFDITPPKASGKRVPGKALLTRDNVMLELGYAFAIAECSRIPIFVVARENSKHAAWVPSDLGGLILCGYANRSRKTARPPVKAGADPALRMGIVNELLRAFEG